MNKSDMHMLGHTILRVTLGLLFALSGYRKLMNPEGVVTMLTGIGFPAATFFAWLLLLSELIFGLAVLVGFKVKYTAWPLVLVLLVAEVAIVIPKQGILSTSSLFHIISMVAMATVALVGPGNWAVDKKG